MTHSHSWTCNYRHRCLVDILPDDVLIEIFGFCADENRRWKKEIEAWQTLVHVCRRWRSVVFGSPRRLSLQLVCSDKTLVTDKLDIWPAFPLLVQCNDQIKHVDNIVALLKSNRLRQIELGRAPNTDLDKLLAAMQVPFPNLTILRLASLDSRPEETVRVLPDTFLGGSASRLRHLYLHGIPYPSLPKLLMSATHLIDLTLYDIPHSGYFSPEAMVTALFTLTSLKELVLLFQSPLSRPNWASRHPPPKMHIVLPVLTRLFFKGVTEYLDDLVARIDAPQLNNLDITFFNQILFDTPQLIQFISRTPALNALEEAHLIFKNGHAGVRLSPQTSGYGQLESLEVKVLCRELGWQVSSLEQLCTWCLPPFYSLENLCIYGDPSWIRMGRQDNIENALWLELLQPFTAVKKLCLSKEFQRPLAPAFKELVGGRTMEVLPSLQDLFLHGGLQTSGPVRKSIQQFVATRQASRPIAISRWGREGRVGETTLGGG